jgi:hypothetical protein
VTFLGWPQFVLRGRWRCHFAYGLIDNRVNFGDRRINASRVGLNGLNFATDIFRCTAKSNSIALLFEDKSANGTRADRYAAKLGVPTHRSDEPDAGPIVSPRNVGLDSYSLHANDRQQLFTPRSRFRPRPDFHQTTLLAQRRSPCLSPQTSLLRGHCGHCNDPSRVF